MTGESIHRPSSDVIAVYPMEETQTDAIIELWSERFGCERDTARGWLDDSLLEELPTETFVARDHGNLVGFGVCTVAGPEYIQDYIGLDVPGFKPWEKTGLLHMLAVREARENEGIGSRLVAKRLRYLIKVQGVDGVVGTAWHRDDAPDSRLLFEKFGFEELAEFERYYSRTHGRGDCPCEFCDGACECTASIYARSIA